MASNLLNQDLTLYDVVCLQEPYFTKSGKVSDFPSSMAAFQASCEKLPVEILIPNSRMQALEMYASRDVVSVKIEGNQKQLTIISIYCSPYEDLQPPLAELATILDGARGDVLIVGDFNARSFLWSPEREEERGAMVKDLITSKRSLPAQYRFK